MNDDAVQFALVGLAELLGVAADGVETDDDVAADATGLGIVEGDDVRVVVVPEELAVDAEDVLIVGKEVSDVAHMIVMRLSHHLYPVLKQGGGGRKEVVGSGGVSGGEVKHDRIINGQWTMDNGRWTMDNGQWTMDDGRFSQTGRPLWRWRIVVFGPDADRRVVWRRVRGRCG